MIKNKVAITKVILSISLLTLIAYAMVNTPALLTYAQSSFSPLPATQVYITNLTLTTATTEYSSTIPAATKAIKIGARGGDIKLAWKSGTSGTTYVTIPNNTVWCQGGLLLAAGTNTLIAYMQSPQNGTIAEIEIWR